ncbi:MAG: MBL fold metallo-hydrolase [Fibromonadales bacterium]|nr:MBL fold metallo-hydrolase [Fibromonadales bacterium]
MNIEIHRGSNQIGGCVTEISTDKARVFIDLGADLTKNKEKAVSKVNIDGLTKGNTENSALLITHYHGDHIGRITQAKTDEIYMGNTAKKINMVKTKRLAKAERIDEKEFEFLKKIKTFNPKDELIFGDIKVTPIMIDHSAFDAYSFLIEANGKRVFYTGDFRLHGPRGKIKVFKHFAKNIDCLICEGTNIAKEKAQTEFELYNKAIELFKKPEHKYVFILCSSTNIDRIFEFYHAYNKVFNRNRPFIGDAYQKEVLKIVSDNHSEKSPFYKFVPNKALAKDGFCILIRNNDRCKEKLEKYFTKYPGKCLLVYSMWKGYLNEPEYSFLNSYKYEYLHTSGHADVDSIKEVVKAVNPKFIMPIHTEHPEEFQNLFSNVQFSKLTL